jgi:ABC-type branched-subunit amino acid transport system substrate-binding protein
MSRLALVALATVAVMAGIAATTPTTTRSTTKPARPPGAGVTATTIRVGGLGSTSLYAGADVGARARFQRANASGGVHGRTIDYQGITDDGGNAAGDTQAAIKLARENGVFAVVPTVAADLAGARVLAQQKVPYFGWALSSTFCGNLYGFGFTGCLVPPTTASTAWGKLVTQVLGTAGGAKTAAVITENTPSGQYQLRSLAAGLTGAGLRVVSARSALPVLTAADYAGIVDAVMRSDAGKPPAAIFVVGSISSVEGVQDAVRHTGYSGVFTNPLEYDPHLTALATGAPVSSGTATTETAPANPAMQQLVTDVRAIAPDQPIDQSVIAGYFSADLFLAAVAKAGRKLTVGRLLHVANHDFTYSVPNTVGPTTFPAAHTRPTPCGSLVFSDGSAFRVAAPYSCGKVVALA